MIMGLLGGVMMILNCGFTTYQCHMPLSPQAPTTKSGRLPRRPPPNSGHFGLLRVVPAPLFPGDQRSFSAGAAHSMHPSISDIVRSRA